MVNDFLKDAANRPAGHEVEMSIREFIGHWNAKRRGEQVVSMIEGDLKRAGVTTKPAFTDAWIDTVITLLPSKRAFDQMQSDTSLPSRDRDTDAGLKVRILPSANQPVISISPEGTLERAQALMMRHDYSQLAVFTDPRDLRGAVSWESIAQARITNPKATLREAIKPGEVVGSDDDLLEQIPRVVDAGFVFVRGQNKSISGIITTADLSNQFGFLARPFFVLAEIERRLRRVIDRVCTPEEMSDAADPKHGSKEVTKAADLAVGGYIRLLEQPKIWSQLGWDLERKEFISALEEVRTTRNEIMHFSPDPLDEAQIQQLENFVKWLRKLEPER